MRIYFVLLLSSLFSCAVNSEIAVIVHPSNAATLSNSDIKSLFLGRKRTFSDGKEAVPINLSEGTNLRSEFNQTVLNKSDSQLKAYWSKLVFTGKGSPPKEVSDGEILTLVSNNPNFIGYVDATLVNDSVKVVSRF